MQDSYLIHVNGSFSKYARREQDLECHRTEIPKEPTYMKSTRSGGGGGLQLCRFPVQQLNYNFGQKGGGGVCGQFERVNNLVMFWTSCESPLNEMPQFKLQEAIVMQRKTQNTHPLSTILYSVLSLSFARNSKAQLVLVHTNFRGRKLDLYCEALGFGAYDVIAWDVPGHIKLSKFYDNDTSQVPRRP